MQVIVRTHELRDRVAGWRRAGQRIAFVPTMGNLHAGHDSLIGRAGELDERVIVSIFVNPLQFGPREDLSNYPRDLPGDLAKLQELGAAAEFIMRRRVRRPPKGR